MADDRRFRLITNLKATLETISTANGYDLDIPGGVDFGRLRFDDKIEKPFICLVENKAGPESPDDAGRESRSVPVTKHDVEFVVQGVTTNDPNDPGESTYHLLAEIQRCLRPLQTEPKTIQPASEIWVSPGTVRPPSEATKIWHTVTWVSVRLMETGDPYR